MSFLFLSKLLPVFLYPLGLSCVLLMMALILRWKRSRWTFVPVVTALAILLIASNDWVSSALVASLESRYPPLVDPPTAEAIVVLGGATKSVEPPRLMVNINEHGDRLFYAAHLYHTQRAPVIILAGGRISWQDGPGSSEAADMAILLEMLGVPREAMIEEPFSLNTHENAVNVQEILQETGIKRILLVTSAFHMPRSMAIFTKLGIEAIPAPTDFLVTRTYNYTFEDFILNLLPHANRLALTNLALKEYLGIVVYRLRGWL
ncbi:MAG: YdcF family protein [Gloeocapsa sp. DLM2.Bin57]|jgi:uncharacterized SAM-binding protein YcdF (DUF218 family)|nr:MAG: YdcF family protein [Gloeocapsa sp. DLM2.Bin57]